MKLYLIIRYAVYVTRRYISICPYCKIQGFIVYTTSYLILNHGYNNNSSLTSVIIQRNYKPIKRKLNGRSSARKLKTMERMK